MKKHIKYIVVAVILILSAAGGIFYMMMPLPVRMTEIRPQAAELSFTEQGIVSTGRAVLVFPSVQGEIKNLYAQEGQSIRAGEILVSVDDSALRLRLEQVKTAIRGLEAQLANVSVEAANLRQNLNTNLRSLQGELRAIDAQAALSGAAFANQNEVLNEQIRLQQVVIESRENELKRVSETLERTQILYEGGVVPRVDLNSAETAVSVASANLEAAKSQMTVIIAGAGINDAEHFEGIRASINAQIAGINQQLNQDTTIAARAALEAQIAVEELNAAQIEREIANSIVTAPVDGVITVLHAQNTNFISAVSPVAEITTNDDIEINVFVSTQDVSSIKIGDRVGLTLRQRTNDIEFFGYVIEIENIAVARFTALGVEERKVNIKIAPEIPQGTELGDGFAVDTTFFLFREENQIVVPRTAVFRADGMDMVWLVNGDDGTGILEAIPVVTGTELRTDIVIERGLSVGDFIVNDANNADLRDGVRVVRE
jgi:HlyD family secretion protein